jgi:hypothetical protein
MPIISALRRLRQEEQKFMASLGLHRKNLTQNKQTNKQKNLSYLEDRGRLMSEANTK